MLCVVVLVAVLAWPRSAKEKHFLEYSEDGFKSVFISGNLTAAVTHDWPRIVFEHSTDPFSSTFEVGFPRLFLYNDTNSDGYFALSELTYVSYLDQNHVEWNVTPVEFHHDPVSGEYAAFRMNTTLALYNGLSNETVAVSDWANVTYWFRISERSTYSSNSLGSYLVRGKTDLAFNFTLDILKSIDATGVAFEQSLQGGGSTYMFVVREQGIHHSVVDEFVSARVDESVLGTNFTHGFSDTTLPDQQISFAKEDRTVQAYYEWDSEPTLTNGGNISVLSMESSYFTTNTGMTLHTVYPIGNGTGSIYQKGMVGIDESGFTGTIGNWVNENLWTIVAFTGGMAVLIVVSAVWLVRIRKHSARKSEKSNGDQPKKE